MSDHWGSLMQHLRGQRPPAPFAPAAAVRRRGRQRARRQTALAGVALVAVTGAGVTAAATAIGPPEPAAPAAGGPHTEAPGPTRVPARWLLDRDDLGAGDWRSGFTPEWAEGPYRWMWEGVCPDRDAPSLRERVDQQEVGWTDGAFPEPGAAESGDVPDWVHQVVDLYPPGGARANLRDTRTAVECAPGYAVVDTDLAGDEALLVREPGAAYTAVVRVGEAVATIRAYEGVAGRADQQRLHELADAAAQRLDR